MPNGNSGQLSCESDRLRPCTLSGWADIRGKPSHAQPGRACRHLGHSPPPPPPLVWCVELASSRRRRGQQRSSLLEASSRCGTSSFYRASTALVTVSMRPHSSNKTVRAYINVILTARKRQRTQTPTLPPRK